MRCSLDHQKNIACVQTQLTTEKKDEAMSGGDKIRQKLRIYKTVINYY